MDTGLRRTTLAGLCALALLTMAACDRRSGSAGNPVGKNAPPAPVAGSAPTTPPAASVPALPAGALTAADREFIRAAAEGGLYEVKVAELAVNKASDPAVKSFATMLATQHAAANTELAALAMAKGLTLPSEVTGPKQRVIAQMATLSGKEFDRRFMETVGIDDHKKDIERFEAARQTVGDPQLKAWIDRTLPALREHFATANTIAPIS